jgi:enterochelin esterase-like enzyme
MKWFEGGLHSPTPDHDDDCHDDVILPPGGRPRPAPAFEDGPDPCYIDNHGRDLRIDLLRGFFVVAMIVDHVRGPSPLYLLTGGNRFYASAAEGFILTSGLVAGLVYHRMIERIGLGPTLLKVLQRAVTLYLVTIGLTLLILPVAEMLDLPFAQGIDASNPLRVIVSVLTLHQTYYLVDVMLLYTVLFLVSPLAFVLLDRGYTWGVLAASWLLWGLYQVYPELVSLPWPIIGNYLFNFSAWQVLFFTGLVIGYRQDRLPLLSRRAARSAMVLTGLGVLLLIGVYFVVDPPTDVMPPDLAIGSLTFIGARVWLQDYVFAKVDLRPGRLIASALVFTFMFFAVTVFWRRIQRALGWLLLPLGQHALYAYSAHVILVVAIAIVVAPLNLGYPGPQWLNALIQIAGVLLIWALVHWQLLTPTPRTKRYWYASPVALAIIALIALRLDPSPTHPGLQVAAVAAPAADVRAPRRFGTPIPKNAAAVPPKIDPVGTPTPPPAATPTPEVSWKVVISADALTRIGEFVDNDIQGTLQERWFYSPELDRDMPYWIYLPPDYGTGGRRYPVLYMLHGLGGHRDEWIVYGLINVADRAIRTGDIPPMIIVLPQGDKDYWVNHANDGPRWGEYVTRDLVQHIDRTYRTLREASARAIGGLSMGGWGALTNAFQHLNVFGVVGAHSASLRPEETASDFLGKGEEFASKDPVALARSLPGLERLKIWLDMPSEDPWLDRAELLHGILAGRGIEHLWQVNSGEHGYTYWEEHMLDYVRFYGHALARQ